MTIKGAGTPLWMSEIAAEFGGSQPYYLSQFYRNGGRVTANNTGIPTAGAIGMGSFYGTAKAVSGSASYTTPGTYSFTIPVHQTLTIDVRGGGGGGGDMGVNYGYGIQNSGYGNGQPGGQSHFAGAIVGNGGGAGASWPGGSGGAGTAGGGNSSNTAGGGSAGGAGSCYIGYCGGSGGNGGRAVSVYNFGVYTPGQVVTIVVGGGGASTNSPYRGNAGASGAVYISWT